MDNAKRLWTYETMFPADLAEALRAMPVAWLPVSPLEWHGEALALGCDTAIGGRVCRNAWEAVGGVLLPTLFAGTGTDYARFEPGRGPVEYWELETVTGERNPGSLFVRPVTLELIVRDYLHFLGREGFRLCVLVSGHGAIDHIKTIESACAAHNHAPGRGPGSLRAFYRGSLFENLPEALGFPGSGGHADFEEASLLGSVDAALVDRSRFGAGARDRKVGIFRENAGRIDFEKGEKALRFSSDRLATEVKSVLKEMGI